MTDFRRAFAKLNDEQREALILVGASGFSYEEAAEMCGVAIGTIKSRTNRARARLTELLHLDADEALELTDGATMAVISGNRPVSAG
jgi:RNA polymerase sigma-70 factor (ECF subfamily)